MNWTVIGTSVAAFLTFCIFSFLYRDNPFYKFSESLLVGVSMGYSLPLVYTNAFIPYVYKPIFLEGKYILILPAILGLLMNFRFSKNLGYLARYPIVFSMALTGMSVPLSMQTGVLVQMRSAMLPLESLNLILIFIGTITILMYFFFSKEHTGVYGKVSKIGVWFMMIGFGASFGYTVMARISLLIGRIQFLMSDWLHIIK